MAHPQSGWIFSASGGEGRGESPGRDYCSMLPINHPQHFTQFHFAQIRQGWQCVTTAQKERDLDAFGLPGAAPPGAHETQKHPKVCIRPLPSHPPPSFSLGRRLGIRYLVIFSRGRSPPTPDARVTSLPCY